VKTLDEVTAMIERKGAAVVKMAGVVAGRQERKSARGNRFAFVQLSDTTAGYEVTLFSEALEKCRDHLETGSQVVLTAEATMESDQLKLLGRSISPIDGVVADVGATGLRIYLETGDAIPSVASVLAKAAQAVKSGGRGPIRFNLMAQGLPGEVEIDAGEDFPVNPQIKGAIKSLPGVMTVEEL